MSVPLPNLNLTDASKVQSGASAVTSFGDRKKSLVIHAPGSGSNIALLAVAAVAGLYFLTRGR